MQSNLRFITHRECSMPPVGKKVLLDFSFKENSNDNCRSTITKLLNIHSIRVGIIWQQTNAWDLFEWISGILFQRLVNLLPLSVSLVRWTWCQWWSRDYWWCQEQIRLFCIWFLNERNSLWQNLISLNSVNGSICSLAVTSWGICQVRSQFCWLPVY